MVQLRGIVFPREVRAPPKRGMICMPTGVSVDPGPGTLAVLNCAYISNEYAMSGQRDNNRRLNAAGGWSDRWYYECTVCKNTKYVYVFVL